MKYFIKELASISGISIRTLHHYDAIGLLQPQKSPSNGYRIYRDEEVNRLQKIMFLKELDFKLDEIKMILQGNHYQELFDKHRKLLFEKKKRLEKIIEMMEQIEGGEQKMAKDIFNTFDMSEIEKYKNEYREEVEKKYGEKEVQESIQKTDRYTKDDWKRITEKGNEIFQAIVQLMDRDPSDSSVQQLVHEYRNYITENFYTCTLEIFKGLGLMYIDDERFTKNLDKQGEGFAAYLSKAIELYEE